jgi:hypothetical protein
MVLASSVHALEAGRQPSRRAASATSRQRRQAAGRHRAGDEGLSFLITTHPGLSQVCQELGYSTLFIWVHAPAACNLSSFFICLVFARRRSLPRSWSGLALVHRISRLTSMAGASPSGAALSSACACMDGLAPGASPPALPAGWCSGLGLGPSAAQNYLHWRCFAHSPASRQQQYHRCPRTGACVDPAALPALPWGASAWAPCLRAPSLAAGMRACLWVRAGSRVLVQLARGELDPRRAAGDTVRPWRAEALDGAVAPSQQAAHLAHGCIEPARADACSCVPVPAMQGGQKHGACWAWGS